MRNTCLYIHTRKDNGMIFYVGIGVGKRPYNKGKGQRSYKWLEIVEDAGGFDVTILKTKMTWEDPGDLEVKMIAFYGREDKGLGPLCNLTDGKDGCLGRVMPDKQKKSMVDKQRKTYDEFISQVEELWGFDLQIDRETFNREYYNQKSKISVECVHHGTFQRTASDIVCKRKKGCFDCMKEQKSHKMREYSSNRPKTHRDKISSSKKGKNNQTKEFTQRLKTTMVGSGNFFAKLKDNDVRFIRKNHKVRDKDFSVAALARMFNVSKGTIHSVINLTTYTNVL